MYCSLLSLLIPTPVSWSLIFCMLADMFLYLSCKPSFSLPYFCCMRAALFVPSLSYITLLLLRGCKTTCRLITTWRTSNAAIVLHAMPFYRAYVDSFIRDMRAAILCYISLAPSVASPLSVPWLNIVGKLVTSEEKEVLYYWDLGPERLVGKVEWAR